MAEQAQYIAEPEISDYCFLLILFNKRVISSCSDDYF